MPDKKSRFVLLCQQVLALGTVAALAVPAAGVGTLDIVGPAAPQSGSGGRPASSGPVALVASEPVEPAITDVPLRGVEKAGLDALPPRQAARHQADENLAVLSAPKKVAGFTTVGVTWDGDVRLDEAEVEVEVRSLDDGAWGPWETVEYHDDHGPDPDSAEARAARGGTEPILVGEVDEVQVRVKTANGRVPADAELAIVDPQATPDPTMESAAIDTADLDGGDEVTQSSGTNGSGDDTARLTAAADVTARPTIFSRAQWGADEGMRDGAPSYFEVHAGFVHHTVNSNGYTRDQVPSLIRGIYAYHTQSRGWSDIGYNFIVDRFGRIWEGRYGGVDRPVVGAHTLGYNEYSFAMSALGNFDTVQPPAAMVDAYGKLYAWKLSLHGVSADDPSQRVGSSTFPAINGHRDAGQTACPGRYLYAKLGTIRSLAAGYQRPFDPRDRDGDLAGTPWPDLAVRDARTRRVRVVRTGGQTDFGARIRAADGYGGMDLIAPGVDLTGDRIPDVLARTASTGEASIYAGRAGGMLGARVWTGTRFGTADQLAAVGDLTGDGNNDVVARAGLGRYLFLHPGNGRGGFRKRVRLSTAWAGYDLTASAGDLNGDGRAELLARSGGTLWVVPRTSTGLGTPRALPGQWGAYSTIVGGGDLTGDRHHDILVQEASSRLVHIVAGRGNGTLGPRLGPFTQFQRVWVRGLAGNMAGNWQPDVMVRSGGGSMFVYPHNGRKNVAAITDSGLVLDSADVLLNVGDWNGDGSGDIMTRSPASGDVSFHAGNGSGGFAAPVVAARRWGGVRLLTAVGDITGDGYPDLMGQPSSGGMRIYPGNGRSGFQPSYVARSAISADRHAGVGMWNEDGSPDSLVRRTDGTLHIYPGNGPGGLLGSTQVGSGTAVYDWLQSPGDATGDGRPDLIGREKATGVLWILPGRGNGFAPRRVLGYGFGRYDLGSN